MWLPIFASLVLPLLAAATPAPISNAEGLGNSASKAFLDFPVNVIMTAGAAQFGLWVPVDGFWYDANTLTCLNAGANSYGSCEIPSFDRIGVVAGNGPCTIIGTNGFSAILHGNAGDGFTSIAPPQQFSYITCGI